MTLGKDHHRWAGAVQQGEAVKDTRTDPNSWEDAGGRVVAVEDTQTDPYSGEGAVGQGTAVEALLDISCMQLGPRT